MFYVGLDVHAQRSSMCILDANGKLVKHLEVKGSWQRLFEVVDLQVPKPFAVCYEASCGYGHLYDQFAKRAQRIKVAHPGQLRLIFRSKKKHDRVDGDKLAKLLYLDEVPAVHVPGEDVRAWRGLIGYRRKLVGRRAAVKTQIWKRKCIGLKRNSIASGGIIQAWCCCRRFRAWARARPRRLWRMWMTSSVFRGRVRWAVILGWCPARMPRLIAITWDTSPKTGLRQCGGFWPRRPGRAGVAASGSPDSLTG